MQTHSQLTLLRGLRYFDAVARHGSVSGAAVELGVSTSAVSHQISSLCQELGEKLYVRTGQGIKLTPSGKEIFDRVGPALRDIAATISDVLGNPGEVFSIAVCSSFGPSWLSPRLPDFFARYPKIELEVRLYGVEPEQTYATADAVVTAERPQPGFTAVTLFDEHLVAVARPNPRFAAGKSSHLITTDPSPRFLGADWNTFRETVGVEVEAEAAPGWLRCTHYALALSMAKAGLGVALVPDFVALDDLKSGALVLRWPSAVASGRRYSFCYKESRKNDPHVRSVARWLKSQARESIDISPFAKPVPVAGGADRSR